MTRRLPTLAVVVLLTLGAAGATGWLAPASRPQPARAQVVTPDPTSPSFANQKGVIAQYNLDPAVPTFASGHVDDPNTFPESTVRVHNEKGILQDQNFWLSVRVRHQDAGVEIAQMADYATYGLIAPGGDATYRVRFPETTASRIEFEVDGSTPEAVALTLLQFAVDAGFATAGLAGLSDRGVEVGLALAEAVTAEYLKDLDTFVPCANAVESLRRGTAGDPGFVPDVQACLARPLWVGTVDGALAKLETQNWFGLALQQAGLSVPGVRQTLLALDATRFAAQVWGMLEKWRPWEPEAMVGTVAFLGFVTGSPATESPPMPTVPTDRSTPTPPSSPETESGRADALLKEHGIRQERPGTETVIVRSEATTVDDPAFEAAVRGVTDALRAAVDLVAGATNYYELSAQDPEAAAGLVSADRRTTIIPVTLVGNYEEASVPAAAYMLLIEHQQADGFEVLTVGDASIGHSLGVPQRAGSACDPMESLPPGEVKIGLAILAQEFAAGMVAPVEIVVAGNVDDPSVQQGITDLQGALAAAATAEGQPLFGPATLTTSPDNRVALIAVPLNDNPCSPAAFEAVERLRAEVIPPVFGESAEVLVTGQTARYVDGEILSAVPTPTPVSRSGEQADPQPVLTPIDPLTLDPELLYNLLLNSAFSDSELPPGFSSAEVAEEADDGVPSTAIGAVGVTLEPGRQHVIGYIVFRTAEDAQSAYDEMVAEEQRSGFAASTPAGFAEPAVVLSGVRAGYGAAACAVRVGNVLIVGGSGVEGGAQVQAETNAIDLTHAAIAHLERLLADTVTSALRFDRDGGLEIVLRAKPSDGNALEPNAFVATRDTVARRVEELGIVDAAVQVRGADQILVELPGEDDLETVVRMLSEVGLFEIVDSEGQFLPEGMIVTTTLGGPWNEPATSPTYTTIVDGSDLADAYPTQDATGQTVVGFELDSDAADDFFEFTNSHLGQPMSIVLDKRVISSPVINGAIAGEGIITGMSPEEVNDLVIQLRAGALPVPVEVVSSHTIDPAGG